MSKLSYKPSYRRRLPHIQPKGGTFFVTSRLVNSLPADVIEKLMVERERINRELEKINNKKERADRAAEESWRMFERWDHALDKFTDNVRFLSDSRIAELVSESLHYRDGKVFELLAFSIMPNHIHLVFTPLKENGDEYYSLSKIMHSLKLHTAYEANHILSRSGSFWQHENYDHFIRDEVELGRIIKYVLYNPVKANMVKEQADWKWSYSKYEM